MHIKSSAIAMDTERPQRKALLNKNLKRVEWQQVQSRASSLIWNGVRLFFNITLPLLCSTLSWGIFSMLLIFRALNQVVASLLLHSVCVNLIPDADSYAWRYIGTFFKLCLVSNSVSF